MADLHITAGIWIPDTAIAFRAIRSAGPGGQNVNKVASKVELRVDVSQIVGLSEAARARLRDLAGKRLLETGELLVTASETRNQLENRQIAEAKIVSLVQQALVAPKARRATKPTKASKERRLTAKQGRSERKQSRGRVRDLD
ncbi:MAG TPA: alternative ribosome rescue aminoacyl-tRNA hydrolase ArfB [Stenomitos sp.]